MGNEIAPEVIDMLKKKKKQNATNEILEKELEILNGMPDSAAEMILESELDVDIP